MKKLFYAFLTLSLGIIFLPAMSQTTATASLTHLSCSGASDGSITLTVSTVNLPVSFTWSGPNGFTNNDLANYAGTTTISSLDSGTYFVTITDNGLNTLTANYTLTEPAVLSLNPTITNVDCNGSSNGSIQLFPAGGTPEYSYAWSVPGNGNVLANQSGGNYSVTLTDAHSCSISATYTIDEPTAITIEGSLTHISCFGLADGAIDVNITGGTPPYTQLWTNSSTTEDLSGLTAGDYTLGVYDDSGCYAEMTFTLTQPNLLALSAIIDSVNCYSLSDGEIDLTISGGTQAYDITWSNDATTEDIDALVAGNYSVTVTDDHGCIASGIYTVSEPAEFLVSHNYTDVSCYNAGDGFINLTPAGGTTPYDYLWSNAATSQDLTDLGPGTYSVTVSDYHNCIKTLSFTIDEPALLTVGGVVTNNTCYAGHSGGIVTTVNGGTSNFSYAWSNSATTANLSGLIAGNYALTVTDANGCTATNSFTLTEPANVITISGTVTNVSCPAGTDGQVSLGLTGGTSPYIYQWSNSTNLNPATGLVAGTYEVTVTDDDAACSVMSFSVTQPAAFASAPLIVNVSCNNGNDGSINPVISGGTTDYSYNWTGPGTFTASLPVLTNLSAGTYYLTVTDDNTCPYTVSYEVTEPEILTVTGTVSDVNCFGTATGIVNITVDGGTPGFDFEWSNGSVSEDLNGVITGTYTVTVTDALGCSETGTWTVDQPTALVVTLNSSQNITCPGGSDGNLFITASGSVPSYTYLWSDGSTLEDRPSIVAGAHTVTVTDSHQCTVTGTYTLTDPDDFVVVPTITHVDCNGNINGAIELNVSGATPGYSYLWSTGATTTDISSLAAGDYTVTITDSENCPKVQTFTVTEPEVLTISGTAGNPSCFEFSDGTISVLTVGGTEPYSWSWSDAAITEDRSGLTEGIYSVTVTDANNCTSMASFSLVNPDAVTGSLNTLAQSISCSGNTITPVVFTADNYSWEETAVSWTRDEASVIGSIAMSGSGEISGTLINNTEFPVTVTFTITPSALGCQGPSLTSTVVVPPNIQDSVVINSPILCFGDTAEVSVYPYWGNAPYSGAGVFNWTAGVHVVQITDNTGCVIYDTITLTQPGPLQASVTSQNTTCYYDADGSINITTAGGTEPYTWTWNDGYSGEDREYLSPGFYTVTITDDNNCSISITTEINYTYPVPGAIMTAPPQACYGNAHPLTVNFTGTPPFSFTYMDGTQLHTISGINTYEYTFYVNIYGNTFFSILSVQDAHCSGEVLASPPAIVMVLPLPTGQFVTPAAICAGDTAIIPVILTGTPPWSITYFDGAYHTISNIMSSPYSLEVSPAFTKTITLSVVKDVNCFAQALGNPVTALVRQLPTASFTGGSITRCIGVQADLPLSLTGTAPWSVTYTDGTNTYAITGITTPSYHIAVNPNVSTTYSLVGVQDLYCTGNVSGQVEVIINPRPVADWTGSLDTICEGASGLFSINLSGTPPWTLSWYDLAPHTATNILTSPFTFTASPAFSMSFIITALSDANCAADVIGQALNVFVDKTPTAKILDLSPMCTATGGDLKIELTGVAPWRLTWLDGDTTRVDSNILVSPHYIHVSPTDTTQYQLLALEDAYCTGNADTNSYTVIVYPSPVATVSGISPLMEVCQGTNITVTPNFISGAPGYTMLFKDANQNYLVFEDLHQGDVVTLVPPVNAGVYPYQLVSITDSNGCFITFNTSFIVKVNANPIVNAGPDFNINLGDSVTLQGSYTASTLASSILWTPSTLLSDVTVLNPVAKPIATTNYTLHVTDSNGCMSTDQTMITVLIEQAVYGFVKYDNNPKTPLSGVKVILINNQGVHLDSTTTNASGYYEITEIINGNYSLILESPKPWMLQNATDALLILKHFVQISPLHGIRLKAANVDATGPANSTDALLVAKRFTGQLSSFALGNWVFEEVNFTIPDTNYQHNILGLCAGDVNGSSIPAAKLGPSIFLQQKDEISVPGGQTFSIPVRTDKPLIAGAMSVVLNYPTDKLIIENIRMDNEASPVFQVNGDEIRIAWYALTPMAIDEDGTLFTIQARLKTSEATVIPFELSAQSQLADTEGQILDNVNLYMPKISVATASNSLQSAPNPASYSTRCDYTIAENATVKISLADPLGKEIRVLQESAQTAGNHSIEVDLGTYSAGLYFLKMEIRQGNGRISTLVEKLSIIK